MKAERVAWAALLVGALDAVSTWFALRIGSGMGVYEGNPGAAWLQDRLGLIPTLVLAALAGPAVVLAADWARRRLPGRWPAVLEWAVVAGGLLGFVCLRGLVVANNFLIIGDLT